MSWKDLLQDASFRGTVFDCVRTRDSAKRGLAEHEYPYVDGADVEDLGRRARRISMTAVFWGDAYESKLQAFIKLLDQAGAGELIHPVFGSVPNAQVDDYDVKHDAENPDHCIVEMLFLESKPSNPFFAQQLPSQKADVISALTDGVRSSGISAFSSALDALKSVQGTLSRLNALRDVMTGTLSAVRSQVQDIVGTSLDIIEYPQAFAGDIVSYLSGMADLRSFDVGVIVSDWKSLTGQLANTVQLPPSINSGTATIGSNAGVVPAGVTSTTNGAGGSAPAPSPSSTLAVLPSAVVAINGNPTDVATVQGIVQLAAATQLADTASTIFSDESADPTLSPADIELIVNDTRTAIQAAIDSHRALYSLDVSRPITESLKDIALAVQTAAIAVIDERPPLATRIVMVAGNLHLTAVRWYGDFTRAEELARLNPQITNPNFLMPGDVLNAYSQ